MTTQLVVFYLLGAVTVLSSLGVVLTRNVVHAAFMLLVALLAVAGIFLVAVAEFLALAQILIYGGAVTVVVLFAIMLTRTDDQPRADHSQLSACLDCWSWPSSYQTWRPLRVRLVSPQMGRLDSKTWRWGCSRIGRSRLRWPHWCCSWR